MRENKDEPAYPIVRGDGYMEAYGLTKREHAAISLRVPDSGDPELDAMIRKARRWDMATAMAQGFAMAPGAASHGLNMRYAVTMADAILSALDQPTKEGEA